MTKSVETRIEPEVVGRVIATESKPNTAYEFHFWTQVKSPVGIGTLVKVDTGDVEVFGVVVEGWAYTDIASAMHDFIGLEGEPSYRPMTERPEIRCYTAAVLRMDPEEPVQPAPVGAVYLADDTGVRKALRMDAYADRSGVAVGAYQNGSQLSPVYLDANFLIGPEAAHANLTGVSGLATKTSTIEFMLQSIFASSVPSVACVCFNVKGHDMLFLDFPAEASDGHPQKHLYLQHEVQSLTDEDRRLYDALGVPCREFDHVEYFTPYKEDFINFRTLRTNEAVSGNVHPLAWGLRDIMEFAETIFSRDDVDAKADALIQYIKQKVIDAKNGYTVGDRGPVIHVHTFQDLNHWFEKVFEYMENRDSGRGMEQYKSHNYATIRKVHNRLSNLVTRYKGLLVTEDDKRADLPWGSFQDRAVYVVDIAGLDSQGQDLVVTRVVHKLKEHLEGQSLGVEKCVVVMDELNKYAPSDGPDTNLKKTLLDISERGRYIGLVLFSAQQFRSQVHKRVVGNSGTSIYGRMDMDELSTPGYQVLTRAEREKLATLSKGQLMVRHPHFSQAIFVKFPRPNVLRGADGIKMFPPAEPLSLADTTFQRIRRLDPTIQRNQILERIEGRPLEDVFNALNEVEASAAADPLAAFDRALKKKAGLDSAEPAKPVSAVPKTPDDPFED